MILDPDEEVRGAVALAFRLFRETGSAFAVVQQFTARGLRFPKRAYGGAWNGKLIWGRLTRSRVPGILKNPSYAGMYVFGRYQYRLQISAQGEVRKRMQAMAMPDWPRLAGLLAGAPRRVYYGGRVFCQAAALAEESHQWRGNCVKWSGT